MATQAHCAYCFETLSSTLSKTPSLSLHEVETLWKKWNNGNPITDDLTNEDFLPSDSELEDPSTLKPAGVSRLLAPSPSTGSSSSVQSVASTPSRMSEASSATSKSESSNTSRSSFFGLRKKLANSTENEDENEVAEEHPLFVTWNTMHRSGEKRLRGCIGTFEALELEEGLRSYTLTSALDDTRFHPISFSELPRLEVGVTLLTNFEPLPLDSPLDWEIGTHGLRISFTYHGHRYGSTYLPDVAKEQGWTKDETMVSLMRKAGWSGRKEHWRSVGVSVVRYQGRQMKLGYSQWAEWRDWLESTGRI